MFLERNGAGPPANGEVTAVLDTIDPVIDPASQTFRCVFTIDNREARMPAGFTVSMEWKDQPAPGVHAVEASQDTP